MTIERQEYDAMRARLQELEDIVHLRQAETALASGETEALPIDTARRLVLGEPPVRVWREYRGMTLQQLAAASGVPRASIEAVEAAPADLALTDATRLARALAIDVEDLTPAAAE